MMGNTAINIILLTVNLFCAGILFLYMHRKSGSSAYAGRAVSFTENVAGILEFSVYGAGMIRIADLVLQGIASPGRADGALFAVRVLLTESMLLLFPLWKLLDRWNREESFQGAGVDWEKEESFQGAGTEQKREESLQGAGTERKREGSLQGAGTARKREESLQGAGADWERGGVPGQAYGKRGGSRFREQICGECGNKPGYEAWSEESSCLHFGIWREGEFFLGLLLLLWLTLQGWQEQELLQAFGRQVWVMLLFFCYEYLRIRRQRREDICRCQDMGNSPSQVRLAQFLNGNGQDKLGRGGCAGQNAGYRVSQDIAGNRGTAENRDIAGNIRQAYEMEYLRNVEQQYQRTRELWHDLKNHIRVLEILAEEGRFGELTDYLDSFRRDVERRMVPARTGCAPVDALLGDKLYQAGRQGVEMKMELCTLSRTGIEAVDLCVILGNLLDNALEACAGLPGENCTKLPGEKRIKVRIQQEETFYYITVVNTAKEPIQAGEGYLSGKRNRDNGVGHGLGLRSAQRAAHRYGGLLVTDYSDGEFKAVVRLQGEADAWR
ncbi:MAG: sensor histidine kinase [Lachnospiraceae bacterium]|nr:sensor histidine kinase [Lachnospiraceae bacterium]